LELWIKFIGNPKKEFIDDLKAIAIHCNQLKSFKINVMGINTAVNNIINIISAGDRRYCLKAGDLASLVNKHIVS
jgi:hypothetical protein